MKNLFSNKKFFAIVIILIILILAIIFGTGKSQDIPQDLSLNKETVEIVSNDSVQLNLGTVDNEKIEWKSSDEKIATVDNNGLVTGKAVGNAKITAKHENKEYSCEIKVEKPEFTADAEMTLNVGETKQINVKENSANNPAFFSKNAQIATVDDAGNVTGKTADEVEIEIKLNGEAKICKVKVVAKDETANKDDEKKPEEKPEEKPVNGTDNKKPSNGTDNKKPSTPDSDKKPSKPNNGGSNNGNNGNNGSTEKPKPTPKPDPKPEEPKPTPKPDPEPTYTYIGSKVYNWAKNEGLEDTVSGKKYAFIKNPNLGGYFDTETYLARIQNVGSKSEDYNVILDMDIQDLDSYNKKIVNNLFENGSSVISKLIDTVFNTGKYSGSFNYNNRTYKFGMNSVGWIIHVSPKKS